MLELSSHAISDRLSDERRTTLSEDALLKMLNNPRRTVLSHRNVYVFWSQKDNRCVAVAIDWKQEKVITILPINGCSTVACILAERRGLKSAFVWNKDDFQNEKWSPKWRKEYPKTSGALQFVLYRHSARGDDRMLQFEPPFMVIHAVMDRWEPFLRSRFLFESIQDQKNRSRYPQNKERHLRIIQADGSYILFPQNFFEDD